MYLVMGVTGNTGSVVASRLLDAGAPVRVLVRDARKGEPWAARGAEVVVGDLDDVASLRQAFASVKGAWVLLPPNPQSDAFLAGQARRVDNLVEVLPDSGLEHLVFLSSVAAQYPAGTGPIRSVHDAEKRLSGKVPRITWIRAAYFIENLAASFGGISDGIFPTFNVPDAAFDMVATADIGRVAADALLHGGRPGAEIIELASGPRPYSINELAGIVSGLVGRKLQVVQAPIESLVPTFTQFGLSEDVAGLYAEMTATFNQGGEGWERPEGGWFVRGPTRAEQVLAKLLGR